MCMFLFWVVMFVRWFFSFLVDMVVGFLVLGSFRFSWLFWCIEMIIGFCLFFSVLVLDCGRLMLKFRVSSGVVIMKMISSISMMLM